MLAFISFTPLFPRGRVGNSPQSGLQRKSLYTALLGTDVLSDASRVGVGTWSWGNRVLYQYDTSRDDEIQKAFNVAVTRGLSLFDTGDSYGTLELNARAEVLLGKFLRECPVSTSNVVAATKLASYPLRLTRQSIVDAAELSAERLGRPIDLAQVHWSPSNYLPFQERILLNGFADALEKGYARAIGVSNFGPRRLVTAADYLEKERGVRLCSVQVQLSLLSREPLTSGLIPAAQARGIEVIGYSPLCLGLLAGGADRSRGFLRDFLFENTLKGARPVQAELASIAAELQCTQAQLAVAWCLTKGVFVLTGVRLERHAEEAAQAENVASRLTDQHIQRLEEAANLSPQMVRNVFQTA